MTGDFNTGVRSRSWGVCPLCQEPVERFEAWSPINGAQPAHQECLLREVTGGIGHHIAHGWWCVQQHDPDAGLTFRQSARMVGALVDILGVEEVTRRSIIKRPGRGEGDTP